MLMGALLQTRPVHFNSFHPFHHTYTWVRNQLKWLNFNLWSLRCGISFVIRQYVSDVNIVVVVVVFIRGVFIFIWYFLCWKNNWTFNCFYNHSWKPLATILTHQNVRRTRNAQKLSHHRRLRLRSRHCLFKPTKCCNNETPTCQIHIWTCIQATPVPKKNPIHGVGH